MGLDPGDVVVCRVLPRTLSREATVVSARGGTLVLRMETNSPLSPGHHLVVSDAAGDHFGEVVGVEDGVVTVRRTWSNSRDHFRVDDRLHVAVRKAKAEAPARLAGPPGGDARPPVPERPDPSVSPRLWEMLVRIAGMLETVLDRLAALPDEPCGAPALEVNLSASGARLTVPGRYERGDLVELRMTLPVVPPVSAVITGRVVRSRPAPGGSEISIRFSGVSERVREVLVRYTLQRQRDALLASRGEGNG